MGPNQIQLTNQFIIEILRILVEITKALAWPFATLSIVQLLQDEIKDFIKNMALKISVGETQIEATQQKHANEANTENEKAIKTLASQAEEYKNIAEIEKKDKEFYMIRYHFEKTYRIIFGSQIKILQALMNSKDQKLPKVIVEAMHRRSPVPTYPFEEYIRFLITSYLIEYIPKEDNYSITRLGFLFIDYLNKNNIPLDKSL